MVRTVSILGATGSVGQSAVQVIERDPGRFRVHAVTAGSNAMQLAETAIRLNAAKAVVRDKAALGQLKDALAGTAIDCHAGDDALEDVAAEPVDVTLSAIVGAAGVRPTAAAVRAGNTIALANKECLTCAGSAFMELAAHHGVKLLPVDSEHNAVFQLLQGKDRSTISLITLTASGGPFRDWPKARLATATPRQAVAHPVWAMGNKISVDSATLMNKGLELIEARHLFALAPESLEVVIHPQSVVHAFITLRDGSMHAEMGAADMRRPIAHCLYWPEWVRKPFAPFDLAGLSDLTFEAPDLDRFPALQLAREAMIADRGAETILNAANEVAVASFLENRIAFTEIADIVYKTLSESDRTGLMTKPGTIDDALELDMQTRRIAAGILPQSQRLTS